MREPQVHGAHPHSSVGRALGVRSWQPRFESQDHPGGDGPRSVAAAVASWSRWAERAVSDYVGTLDFQP